MSDDDLKTGDVVQLKSGGPRMTVTQVGEAAMTGRKTVWCIWFDRTTKLDGDFPPETLERMF